MPPRRRPPKNKAASISTRVHKIISREQWESMLKKAGSKRPVIVQFYQSHLWASKQMSPMFIRFSVQPKYRSAIFAEVDVDKLEDLARGEGIKRIPAYHCYWEGQCVDTYEGGVVDQLSEFISRNVKEHSMKSGPLALALKFVAAAALLAGGALIATRYNTNTSDGDAAVLEPGSQILELKKRITTAQGRIRNFEKANRGKQARVQKKLVEQLTAQVRALEKKEEAPLRTGGGPGAAAGAKNKSNKNGGGGGGGGEEEMMTGTNGSRSGSRRRGPPLDSDAMARLMRRARHGEVLYSDEEDVVLSAAEAILNQEAEW